ncbi:MAG TPA: amidohydrolase family protein [Terriglobia bacterium]|nr:amidohydrolase family protein [Terriglobia bacterium]
MNTSRRKFLKTGLGALAYAGAPQTSSTGGSTILKGGRVLSLDPAVGDFDKADVLIQGSKIVSVQPNIRASAKVIDASNMIVMPGFVDTHRHAWEAPLRNILPNGLLTDYTRDITGTARAAYRPEDAYVGDLVTALGAINAGVTTMLDWSHIGNSPEHTDAAIRGLKESGIRAVYAFGGGAPGPSNQFPQDIRRLRKQYFSSEDQLLTLAMAAGVNPADWAVAREVGAPITVHVNAANQLMPIADAVKSDVTCVHANNLTEAEWQLVAKAGAHISIACAIEMEMGHGVPAIQPALDHGIKPSLSLDVETEMPGDFFTQMRAVFTLQRMQRLARERAGEKNVPALLTVREVVEFATVQGSKDNRLDRKVGTLTPGKDADIILLRTDQINVMPINNAYGAVVLGMDTSNVDSVFIAGKLMKSQGKLVGIDMARITRLLNQSREYITSKTGLGRG